MNSIPVNVTVVCSYGSQEYAYINPSSSVGSPYTVSVGQGLNGGYYTAEDAKGRIAFTSSDCTALSNSVTALGGNINYGSGFFPVNRITVTVDNTTIRGQGNQTQFSLTPTAVSNVTFHVTAKGFTLENVNVEGNNLDTSYGVMLNKTDYGYDTIQNCYFSDFKSAAIYNTASVGTQIQENRIIHCMIGIWIGTSTTVRPSEVHVINNYIYEGSTTLTTNALGVLNNGQGSLIQGNTIIFMDTGIKTLLDRNAITGNCIDAGGNGITLWDDGTGGSYATMKTTISNNIINQNQRIGIFLYNGVYGVTIMGNDISDNSRGSGKNNTYSGILLQSNCIDNIISGNIIMSYGYGTGPTQKDGVELLIGCTNNIITNNQFRGNLGYGVNVGSESCINNTICLNVFTESVTGAINGTSVSGLIIEHNQGYP
jgi:parallel beta-helix repeat protein